MRLHSDTLTERDVHQAITAAGMTGVTLDVFFTTGSRKRDQAYEVKLRGTSNRPPQGGSYGEKAATWDEWGMFLAALYEKDEHMLAGASGRPAYASRYDFHEATGDRFRSLTADQQHRTHRFRYAGEPGVSECKCGASQHTEFMYQKP